MAFDSFIKIDGIKGEAQDSKHKEEIEVFSFSWGANQTGSHVTGGGGGAGKVSVQDFHFTKKTDKASANLLSYCCTGKHIKEINFAVRKAGGEQLDFLKIKMTDVLISSYQTSGSGGGGDDVPMESISLNFTKVQYDYQEQGSDGKPKGGPVTGSWNVKTNTPT